MFLANNFVSGIQAALQDSSDGKIFSRGKRKYNESEGYMVKHIDHGLVLVYLVLRTIIYTKDFSCAVYRKQASCIQYCVYIIL